MRLVAIWLKDGKEVFRVDPVMNIVCDDNMKSVAEIDIENGERWYEYSDFEGEADDFIIKLIKD